MGQLFKKLIVLAATTAASAIVTKYVTKLLDDKPLDDRVAEGKSKVLDFHLSALDKGIEKATALRNKLTAEKNL